MCGMGDNRRGMSDNHSMRAACICTLFLILCVQKTLSFNYDYASACTRPYRSGRSGPNTVPPCDLSKNSYCNRPGKTYPWHAVRRFVHENQGLMRRMYGEQRHIAVLKAEIENNDLDAEMYDQPARDSTFARYSKDHDILNTKFIYSKRPTGRSSESYTVPHFRPVQTTPSTTTTTKDTGKNEKKNDTKVKELLNVKPIESNKQSFVSVYEKDTEDAKIAAYKTSFFEDEISIQDLSKNNLDLNKIEPEIITLEAAIKQTLKTNSVYPNYSNSHKNVSLYSTTLSETIETSPIDTTTSEYALPSETTISPEINDEVTVSDIEDDNNGWKPVMMDKISTLPPSMLFSQSIKEEQNKNDRIDYSTEDNYKGQSSSSTSTNTAATTNMEGQLYQDVVQEEVKPVVKLRGVNACPVKEEVVAPFWANNTRGEVLALLNLYPFEQYVHWEKCTHEHKQMFCRDGCRCEQQYRLHRLLAYDPNNECRGIFSDWFRFPSCCVCKCYDMPLEFRVTSRSPRTIEPEIDEAIKKEMYDQAASDWYTINFDD